MQLRTSIARISAIKALAGPFERSLQQQTSHGSQERRNANLNRNEVTLLTLFHTQAKGRLETIC